MARCVGRRETVAALRPPEPALRSIVTAAPDDVFASVPNDGVAASVV